MKQKIAAALFLLVLLLLALLPRADILRTDVLHAFQDCSPEHLLGTDNLGRDVYSLLAEGAFRTLTVVGLASSLSLTAGTLLYQYRSYLFTCPRLVLCPAAAICLLALWFHVLFDSRAQKDEGTIYD